MKARKYGTTSAKKTATVACAHSLYVPQMPVTLISTKVLFRYHNIRTYFNDDLYMVLPTGERVGFIETTTNYTLVFDEDTTAARVVRVVPVGVVEKREPREAREQPDLREERRVGRGTMVTGFTPAPAPESGGRRERDPNLHD